MSAATPILSKLEDFLSLPTPKVSFEFFPPKNDKMEETLWDTVGILKDLNPHFVSVTYGAGGSTRERTHQTVKRLKEEAGLTPAAHLTCVGASRDEINEVAQSYWDIGVKHIVALRGDPPTGESTYTPHPNGYAYSTDLVQGLKSIADFEISVAAFPEGHPEATSLDADLGFLKEKMEAGADRAITQYCFDSHVCLDFLNRAEQAGIKQPIVPGIVITSNFKQLINFSARCGATVPEWVHKLLEGQDDYPARRDMLSAMIAAEQCRILREHGINQFHFYTLNRPHITAAVCRLLGIHENV